MLRRCCLLLSALLSLSVLSCKDDSGNDQNGIDTDISIVFSQDTVRLSKSGGSASVTITTNGSPVKAESNADWLTIDNLSMSMEGPSTVTMSADVCGYEQRMTTVTVTCGSATKELIVIQSPLDLLKPDEDTNTNLVLQKYYMDWNGSSFFVNYETNGTPTVEMPWWIREVSVEKKDGYTVSAQYMVLKNYGAERTDSVVFVLGDERFSCQIVQYKTEYVFTDVNKTASELADTFHCGWNFIGFDEVGAIEDLDAGLIDTVALAGVNVVRIPFSYTEDMVVEQLTANLKNAIEVVTKRAISNGVTSENLFAIISLNNDSWLMDNLGSEAGAAAAIETFENVWTIVADALAEYDYHVIFEAYDHIAYNHNKADISVYNTLNQTFVDAVRHTGANNFKRCLVIPAGEYDSGIYAPMPQDDETNEDRLFASFNFYQPAEYTQPDATKLLWGEEYSLNGEEWCSYSEDNIKYVISLLHSKRPHVPGIINSCGTITHRQLNDDIYADSEGDYIKFVAQTAKSEAFTPIVYDDGVCAQNSYGIFSRTSTGQRTQRKEYIQDFVEGAGYTYAATE